MKMKQLIFLFIGSGWLLAMQTGVNAQTLINGAGSTFDYPAFTKWFEAYGKLDPNVRFNYQSIGSGGGQKQLLNQTVDFGASDAPMTDAAMANAPGKILHMPVVAGGVAIIYNLPGDPKLKLDGDVHRQHLSRQHHQMERSENRRAQSGRRFARCGDHSGASLRRQRHDVHLHRLS